MMYVVCISAVAACVALLVWRWTCVVKSHFNFEAIKEARLYNDTSKYKHGFVIKVDPISRERIVEADQSIITPF